MKSSVVRLIFLVLLVGAILSFHPQVQPLIHELIWPHQDQQLEMVTAPKGVSYLVKVEDLIFELTNKERQAKGLAPLARDEELRQVARAYSNDMLVRGFFDHTTPDGLSIDERLENQYRHRVAVMGENIWSGSGYDPGQTVQLAKEIVADWMNSPEHRENLLSPDFTHLGVGVSARRSAIRATQEFVGRSKLWPWSG